MHSERHNNGALSAEQGATVQRLVAEHKGRPGPLIEVLHAVQSALGFIPDGAVGLIAHELNLSRAEVHGVVTFYHHFRHAPAGRSTIQICRAEACQSMNGEALVAHAKRRLGIELNGTTPDGRYTLTPVYCLGNCACSPAIMIDEQLHGRVTPELFDALTSRGS